MAEGGGFEPGRRFITLYPLSRVAPLTARPPLRARLSLWALGCQTSEAAESAQRDERGKGLPRARALWRREDAAAPGQVFAVRAISSAARLPRTCSERDALGITIFLSCPL